MTCVIVENHMNEKSGFDINVVALFDSIIRKIWLIILCGVVAASGAYVYVRFFVTPLYSSTATLYVGNSSYGIKDTTEASLSQSLANDFEEIIKRRAVLDDVADALNMSVGAIRGSISVKNISNTRILDITVSTPNPALSKNIADTICDVASEQFVSIVKVDYVSIVDTGSLSSTPSNINIMRSMILAAFAGALICILVIMVVTLRNDKIKTPDDVEFYLGLSVLGTTPFSKGLETDTRKSGSFVKRRLFKSKHDRR